MEATVLAQRGAAGQLLNKRENDDEGDSKRPARRGGQSFDSRDPQAADLPLKAKPIQYVKVCSVYGVGFYYIPGTDICLKVGGYLRAEADVNAGGTLTAAVGPESANNRDNINNRESSSFVQRSRSLWTLDTRAQTDYGIVRSYARTGIQWTTGDNVNAGSGAQAYIDRAFLQFGGLTAGRAVSFFDIYSFSLHSYQTNIIGSDTGGTGINLFAYTADFKDGFSATVSAEEHTSRSKPVVNTIGTSGFLNLNTVNNLGTGTSTSQAGQTLPNLVGNVRLDRAWGAVQASVALADVGATYYSSGDFGCEWRIGASDRWWRRRSASSGPSG